MLIGNEEFQKMSNDIILIYHRHWCACDFQYVSTCVVQSPLCDIIIYSYNSYISLSYKDD